MGKGAQNGTQKRILISSLFNATNQNDFKSENENDLVLKIYKFIHII